MVSEAALERYGPHSASSAFLIGTSDTALALEAALGSLLALATPVATGLMVDTLIPNSDMPGLAQMAGLLSAQAGG